MNTVYTAIFLFCGLGGGALGFLRARGRLHGHTARLRSIGGIDNDPAACADFEYLTGSRTLCTDIARLTPGGLRAFAGPVAPDIAFGSPPCKSFSGLTDPTLAASPEYVEMARLYVTGVELLLSTWDVPPRLILLENVPRILSKGKHLIEEVTEMVTEAGYATRVSSHDCGEIGELAQHRRRALLVARFRRRVPSLLYQPPRRRVRACGEVLGELVMPETESAGPMHRMPRIGWTTWVRLALIPAGGDHRDLPGVLDRLQKRREVWARHHVEAWSDPSVAVTSSGTNGTCAVADPRAAEAFANRHTVAGWGDAARTITSTGSRPIAGGPSVADPRVAFDLGPDARTNICAVTGWGDPARTVVGATRPASGGPTVADPRPNAYWNKDRVEDWNGSAHTITGATRSGSGAPAIADPRVDSWARSHSLGIVPWTGTTGTITAQARPTTGAFNVSDPRIIDAAEPVICEPRAGAYGVLSWEEAAKTITASGQIDNGPFAIADPRAPEVQPIAFVDNPKRSPFLVVVGRRVNVPVVILAEDGTWHRPMTPLELARLQDLPAVVDGAPLKLFGDNVGAWVERIGNAVPVGAAQAIAEQMLLTLLSSDVGAGLLPSGGRVWVQPSFGASP